MQTRRKRRVKILAFFLGAPMSTAGAVTHLCSSLGVQTRGRGFYGLGGKLTRCQRNARRQRPSSVFCTHTSASLCIQENADPDVLLDLTAALNRLAPEGSHYRHSSEGPDDMPAHIKTMLTAVQLSLPVRAGRRAWHVAGGVFDRAPHRPAPAQARTRFSRQCGGVRSNLEGGGSLATQPILC